MIRRLIALALLFIVAQTPSARAEDSRPNVLFIICDDLNCDLGCYGDDRVESPNIDRLAEQGVRFDRAYCQFALCGPSRASFMTGLYPDQTLVKRNAIYIREHLPNVKTMSQMFRDAGYLATRIGKIYHYNVPLHIGTSGHDDPYSWDITVNPRGRDVIEQDRIFSLVPGSYGGTLSWLSADGTDQEQTDGIAADEAIERLKGYRKSKQSFFMAVGLYRPHTPYVAPHDYFRKYPADKIEVPKVPAGYLDTIPQPAVKSIRAKKHQVDLDDDLARQAIQAYHATITFADAQVGRILDALKITGLDQNTVVVFTSDHGYHMGEHGHWQKSTLFENATRVPLIIAGPGVEDRGGVAREPVEMVDFYPTLADLCGLKAPGTVQGDSLAGILNDAASEQPSSALSHFGNGYSIRTARYRYTEWGENGADGKELYDHESDPEEMKNLANNEASRDIMSRLAEQLHERIHAAQEQPKGLTQIPFENRRRVKK
ncbi:sulfatase [Rubinisphaera margarita]|uniref:sulfatase n=1 Tax=Rubinisphaera margarita TaxID=2909586 RepID=UPI001EE847B2|nr:sulfatase [Rubinisphaera margarita]MCG6156097.1 sulfatase [Rubinisphaera margarita]